MSDFQHSEWSRPDAAEFFIDNASRYIPDRGRTQAFLASLVSQVLVPRFPDIAINVLELGCGDGALSHALKMKHPNLSLTLLDGSAEMLEAAKKRFGGDSGIRCIHSTFQDILAGRIDLGKQHFIVSSLAIHHLTLSEKGRLFSHIAHALFPGGAFANIDVVLSPAGFLEEWYLALWREWIREHDSAVGDGRVFTHIPDQYKQNTDNFPDTIHDQMLELKRSGFEAVDVFYKNGLFAVYGGFKPL